MACATGSIPRTTDAERGERTIGASGAPAAPGPLPPEQRATPLDVLRGWAILGILLVNIQDFALGGEAFMRPPTAGSPDRAEWWIWLLVHTLGELKFLTILSLLFGAGILAQSARRESAGLPAAGVHYRRMAVLLALGLLHAYLVWYGDILVAYAICGSLVYALRRRSPCFLLCAAGALIALPSAVYMAWHAGAGGLLASGSTGEVMREWARAFQWPGGEMAAYRAGWLDQMRHRAPAAFVLETADFFAWLLWRTCGLMLAGMALLRLGVLTGGRLARFHRALLAAGLGLGIPLIVYGAYRGSTGDVADQFNYWGSLAVALGWIGLVMLLCRMPSAGMVRRPLAAVGQTALSNYLLQSLICTTIFYGHGLGLFGQVQRPGQLATVLGVWAAELGLSSAWLRRFRLGPAEWLLRSVAYRARQPMLRGGAGTS